MEGGGRRVVIQVVFIVDVCVFMRVCVCVCVFCVDDVVVVAGGDQMNPRAPLPLLGSILMFSTADLIIWPKGLRVRSEIKEGLLLIQLFARVWILVVNYQRTTHERNQRVCSTVIDFKCRRSKC